MRRTCHSRARATGSRYEMSRIGAYHDPDFLDYRLWPSYGFGPCVQILQLAVLFPSFSFFKFQFLIFTSVDYLNLAKNLIEACIIKACSVIIICLSDA